MSQNLEILRKKLQNLKDIINFKKYYKILKILKILKMLQNFKNIAKFMLNNFKIIIGNFFYICVFIILFD